MCIFIFTEHSFSGTGRIHHNTVEISRKNTSQSLWRLVYNKCITDTHALHIFR